MTFIKTVMVGGEVKLVDEGFSWVLCEDEEGMVDSGSCCCVGNSQDEGVLYI